MLVFMCRDLGDTTSKVSCSSLLKILKIADSKYSDAIAEVHVALHLKMSLTRKREYGKT